MANAQPYGKMFKIVLLGSMGSGKSSLLRRLVHDTFSSTIQSTIGACFVSRKMETEYGIVTMNIWDTAGGEQYRSLVPLYYRGAKAAILCCDVTDLSSFQTLEYWIKQVRGAEEQCKIYVCGTKFDLVQDGLKHQAVTIRDLEIFNAEVYETSSKTGMNVTRVFQKVADDLADCRGIVEVNEDSVELEQRRRSACCKS